jgi:PPK2 family polyphosphate:nucleotide phosphotransferase
MKLHFDPGDFRFTGKGRFKAADVPTRLKKPFYQSKADLERRLNTFRVEIDERQQQMFAHDRYGLLLIFQAMDAAGKDGTIRHVMSGINPHGVEVHSFKRPSEEELDHDYLWRTSRVLPPRGKVGIFNRSYYEEVLVCRVHPEIVQKHQRLPAEAVEDMDRLWDRRLEQIAQHEAMLHANGTRIVKFFLHVSREEQRRRFLERIDTPAKNWKFNAGDIAERGHWKEYLRAYSAAINATATKDCPWYIVPADDKGDMRLIVSAAILHEMSRMKLSWPQLSAEQKAALAAARKSLMEEKS